MKILVQRILRIAACTLMTGILLLSEAAAVAAYAAETGIDENQSVTFDMDFEFVDKEVKTPISGAKFTIWQIARLTDGGSYELLPEFSDITKDFNAALSSSSRMLKLAKICKREVNRLKRKGTSAVSDKDGKVSFGTIPRDKYGVYLVAQTGREGKALDYKYIDPFLITLPDRGKDGAWIYKVKSSPKTTLQKEEESKPPTKPSGKKSGRKVTGSSKSKSGKTASKVKTGDTQNIWLWVWVAGGALLVLIGLLAFRRKKK